MKLLIFGATGPTGRQLVEQALEDPSAIASAARGRDAVLSALGSGKSLKGDIASRAAANLVAANPRRLIFMSGVGVGESYGEAAFIEKLMIRTMLRWIYADKAKADTIPRTGGYRVGEHLPLGGFPKISRADVADFMIHELNERKWIRKTVVISA